MHKKGSNKTPSWEIQDLVCQQRIRVNKKKPKLIGSKKPVYTPTDQTAKKKFDFGHMRVSKYADIRKYIAVPKLKESNLTAEEMHKELDSEISELAKPTVCKSTLVANMTLVKKFDKLMDDLGEEKKPTPH